MDNILRGLSEHRIRADMAKLCAEWGSQKQAREATGLARATFGNAMNGFARIGGTVMDALYGPTGTTLRPEIRNAGGPAAPTPPPSAPEAPAAAPSEPETPAEEPPAISAPPEAPMAMPMQPEPLHVVEGPHTAAALEAQGAQATATPAAEVTHEWSVCEIAQVAPPAWLTPALTALDQQAARLAEEITARRTQLVRLEQAMQLLKELA